MRKDDLAKSNGYYHRIHPLEADDGPLDLAGRRPTEATRPDVSALPVAADSSIHCIPPHARLGSRITTSSPTGPDPADGRLVTEVRGSTRPRGRAGKSSGVSDGVCSFRSGDLVTTGARLRAFPGAPHPLPGGFSGSCRGSFASTLLRVLRVDRIDRFDPKAIEALAMTVEQ